MSTTFRRARSGIYIPRGSGVTYDSEVLADGPALYYTLGDPSGSATAVDSSGNGRTGTPAGGITFGAAALVTGDPTTSASSTGTGERVILAHASWMDVPAITMEAIIKPSNVSGSRTIVGIDDVGTNVKCRLRLNGNQLQGFYNGDPSGVASASGSIAAGTVYHVAWVGSSAGEKLYLNGTQVSTATGANLPTTSAGVTIAALSSGPEPYAGLIARVAIYTTALSATRIAAHAALV